MPAELRATAAARTAVPVLLTLGALAYTSWALEAFLPTGLSPLRTYVSELAAEDQPYGAFFRGVDFAAGVLVCAGAGGALLRPRAAALPGVRHPGVLAVAGWAGIALFGAATAADSRLPLSCAPTVDAACAAREEAGQVPWAHSAHTVSSGVAVTGAVIGMLLLTAAVRRDAPGAAGVRRAFAVLLAVELAATVWTLAAITAFYAGHGTWALGIGQRLQVLTIAVFLAVVAWLVRAGAGTAAGRRA
ncbi:DUF998 domain-containing protein [Streptomyces sp. NPDC059063]|uniref:DUF998 domain-containing protein n=1 Tax=unclassified Streptomyces TaxID=2593676 RepID=UPI0036773745